MNPLKALELLFFAIFGQTTYEDLLVTTGVRPEWTKALFKLVFGIYMLVSVVVLINLLIAMMSDTYQRIQVNSCAPSSACVFPVQKNPVQAFELLFFAIFGQTNTNQLKTENWERTHNAQPLWTENLFKMVFGVYMLVSVVVLINLLIAMMTDTYQRIQVTLVTCMPLPCPRHTY